MVRIKRDDNLSDCNYCFSQWKNFTTMTYEESENYKAILSLCPSFNFKYHPKKKSSPKHKCIKVLCKETGIIYESKTACSNVLNIPYDSLCKAIKRKYKIRNYTFIEMKA